jgi:hypothetical protein
MIPPKNTKVGGEDNKDFGAPITKIIPTLEHSLDWEYVIDPPWTDIRLQLGTVNDAAIPLFNNAPIETVLFMSLSGEQNWTTAGAKPWSLSYKFSERNIFQEEGDNPATWNHVYNPSTNKFERIKRKDPAGEEVDMYAKSDFKDLFKSGSDV